MKEFRFTSEEIDHLKKALSRYEPTQVSKFIYFLHRTCSTREQLSAKSGLIRHRQRLTKIRQHVEKTLKDLRLVTSKEFRMIPEVHLNEYLEDQTLEIYDLGFMAEEKAVEAHNSLVDFLHLVMKAEAALGSVPMETDHPAKETVQFIVEIAELFDKHLAQPTAYEKGGFYKVALVVLSHFHLLTKDAPRMIQTGLKYYTTAEPPIF